MRCAIPHLFPVHGGKHVLLCSYPLAGTEHGAEGKRVMEKKCSSFLRKRAPLFGRGLNPTCFLNNDFLFLHVVTKLYHKLILLDSRTWSSLQLTPPDWAMVFSFQWKAGLISMIRVTCGLIWQTRSVGHWESSGPLLCSSSTQMLICWR